MLNELLEITEKVYNKDLRVHNVERKNGRLVVNLGSFIIKNDTYEAMVITIEKNGKRTITKCARGDEFDPYTGVAVAFLKYQTGLNNWTFERKLNQAFKFCSKEQREELLDLLDGSYEQFAKEYLEKVTGLTEENLLTHIKKRENKENKTTKVNVTLELPLNYTYPKNNPISLFQSLKSMV